jgi:hypothetical protein
VLFFIAGDFLRRRRRLSRQTDDVPVLPMVEFLAFWVLLSIGSFCVAIVGFAIWVAASKSFPLDRRMIGGIIALAIVAVVCIERAFVFWWRIRSW